VASILSLFARYLHSHERNQRDFCRVNGVGLLERALLCAADRGALKGCNKDATRELLALCSASVGNDALEKQVIV
jgi:hypothetical protein